MRLCACGNEVSERHNKWCSMCISNRVYNNLKTFDELSQDSTRRKWLLKERGHKCEQCKNTEWNLLPIPLELEHVDGDSDNNIKENLKLLCPNCHAQTKHYKGANKGNSKRQVARRQRYAEGKTF